MVAVLGDLGARIRELAEGCPDYPSLTHPDLPRDFSIRVPGCAEPIAVETLRRAVLADEVLFCTLVLGLTIEPFHAQMLAFCLRHQHAAIEAPRGFGKSTVCTTGYCVLKICRDFDIRILITSETDTQAVDFLVEIRGVLESNEFLKTLFGEFVGRGKWTDHKIVIRQCRKPARKEGTIDAIGMGGAATGKHWEIHVVDDPTSTKASGVASRTSTVGYVFVKLRPTLMPGGARQFRATRYDYDDVMGEVERKHAVDKRTGESHVYHLEDLERGAYVPVTGRMKVLKASAIRRDGRSLWESQQPLKDRVEPDGSVTVGLESIREEIGSRAFNEQYQMVCEEPAKKGERETECREQWLTAWEKAPDVKKLRLAIRVDPAWTSAEKAAAKHVKDRKPDWSAIAAAGWDRAAKKSEPKFFGLELEAGLWSTGELTDRIKALADQLALRAGTRVIRIGIERTGLQIAKAPEFYKGIRAALKPHVVVFINPGEQSLKKVAHARPFFAAAERGDVRLSPDIHAGGFVEQCGDFPFGARDDEIDAMAGAYRMLQRRESDLRNFEGRNQTAGSGGSGGRRGGDGASGREHAAAARGMS